MKELTQEKSSTKKIRYNSTDTLRELYDKQRLTFFDLFKKNWSQIKKVILN